MSPVASTRPPATTAAVKLRLNAAHMTAEQATAYRDAVAAMQGQHDNRGWQYYAGWHGVPLKWCQHDQNAGRLFLPWHRSYLYHLELALQSHDASVTIPWWDWMSEDGIPPAFDGDPAGNPLAGGPIQPFGVAPHADWPTETSRDPGAAVGEPGVLALPLQPKYDWLMEPTDFFEFSRRLQGLHNSMHVWTGGTMSDIDWAAFDPIFFSHHAMVDRLWRIWQVAHPGSGPPASMLGTSLVAGTNPIFTVGDVLDVQTLGYDYAASTASAPGTIGG